uniref:Uncharacterized protein n=1 Tax=Stegastes partitus TaxID=144197 RepID=A0A3B5AKC8_9TELE
SISYRPNYRPNYRPGYRPSYRPGYSIGYRPNYRISYRPGSSINYRPGYSIGYRPGYSIGKPATAPTWRFCITAGPGGDEEEVWLWRSVCEQRCHSLSIYNCILKRAPCLEMKGGLRRPPRSPASGDSGRPFPSRLLL